MWPTASRSHPPPHRLSFGAIDALIGIFSGLLFSPKMGLAIGAGLSGWMLGWFGIVAQEIQSDGALLGIRPMISVFSGMLTLLAAPTTVAYSLTDERVK